MELDTAEVTSQLVKERRKEKRALKKRLDEEMEFGVLWALSHRVWNAMMKALHGNGRRGRRGKNREQQEEPVLDVSVPRLLPDATVQRRRG